MRDRLRTLAELPSALERMEEIAARARGRRVALLLGFDGTLAPDDPGLGAVELPEATRRALRRIAPRHRVAVLSPRNLEDLQKRVDVEGVAYAASGGFRIARPDGGIREHEQARRFLPGLDHAEDALRRTLEGAPGVDVERRRFALLVHCRRVPRRWVADVERAVDSVLAADRGLDKREAADRFEVVPDLEWDTGRAVRWILEVLGLARQARCPIYVGAARSDEDAFRAVARSGVGIAVRGREDEATRARYALDGPVAVRRFLTALDARLEAS